MTTTGWTDWTSGRAASSSTSSSETDRETPFHSSPYACVTVASMSASLRASLSSFCSCLMVEAGVPSDSDGEESSTNQRFGTFSALLPSESMRLGNASTNWSLTEGESRAADEPM